MVGGGSFVGDATKKERCECKQPQEGWSFESGSILVLLFISRIMGQKWEVSGA